jgi:hypothetical protein
MAKTMARLYLESRAESPRLSAIVLSGSMDKSPVKDRIIGLASMLAPGI